MITARGRFLSLAKPTVRLAGVAETATRHLVLAYRPHWQSLDDLNQIARHVSEAEASFRTFIVPGTLRNSVTRKAAATRPSLIVSPAPLAGFRPLRGKVYQGARIPKIEQIRRLTAAGVLVPRTEVLTPDLRLDPAEWGEFVVLKPTYLDASSHGTWIKLSATRRVRYLSAEDYPAGHPGRNAPMLVQQFIDTGDRLSLYRVLTLFGEPLYCQFMRSRERRVDLAAADDAIEAASIASQAVDADESYVGDGDVLAVARAAHRAMPEVPLKGCDIIPEAATGRLYVLEVNPGGNTWHFSSRFLAETRARNGPAAEMQRLRQFDAFRTAARVLAEQVAREAE